MLKTRAFKRRCAFWHSSDDQSPSGVQTTVFFTFIFAVLLLQNIFKILKAGHVLALDGVYFTKKKEVVSFARSKVTEGVPKFKKWVT